MPTPQQILQGLETISNRMTSPAIVWHVILAAAPIAIAAGWRPSNRLIGIFLSLPLLSVSVMAWVFGNPFNGIVFLISFLLLTFFSAKKPRRSISINSGWPGIAGIVLIIFGLVYPHFLRAESFWSYLYKSPLGLVPCPTLTYVIGCALLFEEIGTRGWNITLTVAGLIYGLIGAFGLGVTIDLVLLAGSLLLLAGIVFRGTSKININKAIEK
jgi:hypothetical protein